MPLYEFQCQQCETVFEELVRMGSTGEGIACPKCHGTEIRKQVSTCNGRTSASISACGFAEDCHAQPGGAPGCCGGGCACHS